MTALRWALAAVAIAAAAWLFIHAAGQRLLYPAPPRPSGDVALDAAAERIWLEGAGARTEAFFLASTAPVNESTATPLVLYAHGNGELIDYWLDQFEPLRAAGISVLLVEYPGYGRSAGRPSEASIQHAMITAFDWAASQPRVDREHIIGWGRSLGGGAVCALARARPLAALVLESTFVSVRAMASEMFAIPGFLVRDPFDNLAVVRAFPGPILLLHGEHDPSIPVDHARMLQAAAAHSELHLLPCGHNDCERPWALIEEFLLRR